MDKWSNEFKQKVIDNINSLGIRSDSESDEYTVESFYDHDLTRYLMNQNNQIIQGSRGTGKTHILRVLEQKMESEDTHCIFLDCRQIGSSGCCGLSDDNPDEFQHVAFFQYFLEQLYNNLSSFYSWQYICDWDVNIREKVPQLFKELRASIINCVDCVDKIVVETSSSNNSDSNAESTFSFSIPFSLGLGKQHSQKKSGTSKQEVKQDIQIKQTLCFPKFGSILNEILFLLHKKVVILLDEWSSIPLKIQPFFAEFLRRTFFPISNVNFKIAVVPQRKLFREEIDNQLIGFEVGSDIMIALDLDRLYSVDADPQNIVVFCFSVICKHLSVLLQKEIDPSTYIGNMFKHQNDAFLLVRASEGNPRDFIILTFLCLQGLNFNHIDVGEDYFISPSKIISESTTFFQSSKYLHCTIESQKLLRKLIEFVVYRNKNRAFLIDSNNLNSPHLKALIDARVLHILEEDYSGFNIASEPCAILVLNYGSYCNIFSYGKTVRFFYSGDFLEKRIFPVREFSRYDDQLLPYKNGRQFFRCYVDTKFNDIFAPFFTNDES